MKRIIVSLAFLFFILVAAASLKPSMADEVWYDVTHGINNVDLRTIAIDPFDPKTVYLGSSTNISKSIDGGRSWKVVLTTRGTSRTVNFIRIDPNDPKVLYVATQNGLYKSADTGKSYQRLFSGMDEAERNIQTIAIDPKDSNRTYVGTHNGLFWTDDGGKIWQRSSGELSDSTVRSIAIHPIEPHILYTASSEGVFKTSNIERGWERVFITSEEEVVEDSNVDEAISSPEAVNWVELDPSNPKIVYLGTEDGVFSSVDGGSSWKKMSEEGLLSNEIHCVLVSPRDPNLLYSATRKGVFRFSKELNSWDELYHGITARDIRSLALDREGNWLWAATDKGAFKITLGANQLQAQPIEEMTPEAILAHFAHEPTIQEIQRAAIRYAEVIDPKRIEKLRRGARAKALMPEFKLGYDKTVTTALGSTYDRVQVGPRDWSIDLKWDISDLIWSEQQRLIDSQVRLMVKLRDDILDEVTRLYFERRRLQVELLLTPPENLKTKLEKELRLQELTADIDGLTGGYLSRRLSEDITYGVRRTR